VRGGVLLEKRRVSEPFGIHGLIENITLRYAGFFIGLEDLGLVALKTGLSFN
jgi:hypothetical protein